MTVATNAGVIKYVANGTTTEFAVPFKFEQNTDGTAQIAVYVSGQELPLVENQDYSVTGAGEDKGGMITFMTAPAENLIVAIIRNIPAVQLTQFIEGSKFPAIAFERALDILTMLVQELQEKVSRCISFDPTDMENSKSIKESILEQLEAAKQQTLKVQKLLEDVKANVEETNTAVSKANDAAENAKASADKAENYYNNMALIVGDLEQLIDEINGETI